MKRKHLISPNCIRFIITLLMIVIMGCSSSSKEDRNVSSEDERFLRVMTINLLFPELQERDIRLQALAEYLIEKNEEGEPVDVVLLQEVVGGFLTGTENSSEDLQYLLEAHGLHYHLFYQLSNGLPGIVTVGNAILSRYQFSATDYTTLQAVSEEPFNDFSISLRQDVILGIIDVPEVGEVNVYNTHLCAYCETTDRLAQLQEVLEFVDEREVAPEGGSPVILGGDINTSFSESEEEALYDLLSTNYGLFDTFVEHNRCIECCSPAYGFDGCTYALPGNPYGFNQFTGEQEEVTRLDYIFSSGLDISSSSVIFNSDSWVSDHSAVLTTFRIR